MDEPFYKDGLRFSCARCSGCCRGGPGYVFLSKADLARLLGRFGLGFPEFFRRYCTLVDTGIGFALSFAEKKNYDCIFWGAEGCSIYEDRPVQCSTFPFWNSVLATPETWAEAGDDCPGINNGELRSREYIEERLWLRRSEGQILIDAQMARRPELIDADTLLGS